MKTPNTKSRNQRIKIERKKNKITNPNEIRESDLFFTKSTLETYPSTSCDSRMNK